MSEDNEKTSKEELLKALYLSRHSGGDEKQEHRFWNTQPVPQDEQDAEELNDSGPIEVKKVDDVRKTPYKLPSSFKWVECDLNDPAVLREVYDLLTNNYVEDDDHTFRFDYSEQFLLWALQPPGYEPNFHVGVRARESNKLVGFITGIPATIRVHADEVKMVEINYLCVHKRLRSKRLAPVLIKEITRRVNLTDCWQAVYTAGVVLPRPVAKNRYYHRSLNPKKLIDVGFSRLQRKMTMSRTIKLFKVAPEPKIPGLRSMTLADVPQVTVLLNDYLRKFKLCQVYDEEEVAHWLLPREGVIYSFVVEAQDGKITDMLSFYSLPSSITGHAKYNRLNAAYSFYNVCGAHTWTELMTDALILAKQRDFDVFNALNLMENEQFFKDLLFGPGDGELNYYIYNWRCPQVQPGDIGLVLM